jgi:three-Cys-motif partner protein
MTFFHTKKAAAVLKHAILDQYVDPFVIKTGLHSPGNRVAIIDGYAGEGRYEDGGEGSPSLLMRKARLLAPKRALECYFIEKDEATYDKLRTVVSAEGHGLQVVPLKGTADDHLAGLLDRVADIPLLVFLDPYGLATPFGTTTSTFSRPSGYGAPATELLINFNAMALRRIAGHLTSATPNTATLARMDEVCGGAWWRGTWLEHGDDTESAEDAVVAGYARQLARTSSCGFWITDVRNRADLKPAYHLVFLTRHRDGMYVFGEALSLGLQRWRKVIFAIENEGSLFDESIFEANEQSMADGWIAEIAANLRRLLADGGFNVADRYAEVYGKAIGKAREKHLRAAWKQLHAEGHTSTDSRGKLVTKRIEPA